MAEMSAAQAAKILTSSVNIQGPAKIVTDELLARAVAVDCLRKAASGELREVVHGHWIVHSSTIPTCSVCGEYSDDAENRCAKVCSNCGALMDGKDGSDEAD